MLPVGKDSKVIDPSKMTLKQKLVYEHVVFRMVVHRALLRGNGFFDVIFPQFPQATLSGLCGQIQSRNLQDRLPW
jgi:hypothetical protein